MLGTTWWILMSRRFSKTWNLTHSLIWIQEMLAHLKMQKFRKEVKKKHNLYIWNYWSLHRCSWKEVRIFVKGKVMKNNWRVWIINVKMENWWWLSLFPSCEALWSTSNQSCIKFKFCTRGFETSHQMFRRGPLGWWQGLQLTFQPCCLLIQWAPPCV